MTIDRKEFSVVLAAAIALLAPQHAVCQAKVEKTSSASAAKSVSEPSKSRRSLLDATRVNTDQAAQLAAQKASTKHAEPASSNSAAGGAVLEFQPAPNIEASSKGAATTSKEAGKSKLKNVHGAAYGSLNAAESGNHAAGASAGATSKGGKTSIYVETERTRSTSPK